MRNPARALGACHGLGSLLGPLALLAALAAATAPASASDRVAAGRVQKALEGLASPVRRIARPQLGLRDDHGIARIRLQTLPASFRPTGALAYATPLPDPIDLYMAGDSATAGEGDAPEQEQVQQQAPEPRLAGAHISSPAECPECEGLVERMIAARMRETLAGHASTIQHTAKDDLRPQHGATATILPAGGARRGIAGLRLASLGGAGLVGVVPGAERAVPMSIPAGAAALLPNATPLPDPNAVRLASLGTSLGRELVPHPDAQPSLSGDGIRWLASPDCLAAPLRAVLAEVAANFGPLRVNSTCRSKQHNARVGGAPRSYHLTGSAVDFRISGSVKAVHDFLSGKREVGGLKHYGFGLFHIDTGPRRTWANNSWGKSKKKRAGKRRRKA